MATKLSKVVFRDQVPDVPNLKGIGSVQADDTRPDAGRKGFDIELDEEMRFVRIAARNPLSERDEPICVPLENIKSFKIADDVKQFHDERKPKK